MACLSCISIVMFVVVGPDVPTGIAQLDFEIYRLHVTMYILGCGATKSPRKLRVERDLHCTLLSNENILDACSVVEVV